MELVRLISELAEQQVTSAILLQQIMSASFLRTNIVA
jgi:hypothetical protein